MTMSAGSADVARPAAEAAVIRSSKGETIVVRKLAQDDLWRAMTDGWRDFKAAPLYGLFFGAAYALAGWGFILLARHSGLYFLAYPLMAGFALIAPFVAAGIYEVSRRLEQGLPLSWGAVLGAARGRDLGWMALITGFALFAWIDFAFFIYLMFFGLKTPAGWEFLLSLPTTSHGLLFILVGNVVGAIIAFTIFSLTVVSFPLLLDRDVDFVTAMIASLRTVKTNRTQMLTWAAMIAMLLMGGLLTGFVGLIVVLPLLGHASWKLYKRVIAPAAPAATA